MIIIILIFYNYNWRPVCVGARIPRVHVAPFTAAGLDNYHDHDDNYDKAIAMTNAAMMINDDDNFKEDDYVGNLLFTLPKSTLQVIIACTS